MPYGYGPPSKSSSTGPAGGASSGGNYGGNRDKRMGDNYGSGSNVPSGPKGGGGGPPSELNPYVPTVTGVQGPPSELNPYVAPVTGVEGPPSELNPYVPTVYPTGGDLEEDLETPIQVPTKQNKLLDFFSIPKYLGILGKFLPKTDFQSYYDKYGIKEKYGFTPEQFKNLVVSGDISIKGVPMKGNIGFMGGGLDENNKEIPVRIVGGGEGGQQPSGIQTITTPITADDKEEIDTITEEDVSVDGDRQAYYDDLYEQLIAAGISPSNASMIAEYRADVRFPTA